MAVPSVLQGLRSSQRLTRRVVITGIGLVTPLGCGNESVWKSLISSQHGISTLDNSLIVNGTGVSIAGIVPRSNNVSNEQGHYNEELVFGRSVSKELAGFCQYAVYASDLALAHAGLMPETMSPMALDRAGVAVASGGIGSLQDIVESSKLLDVSYKKVSPYFVPKILSNMAAGHVSIRHKFRGPVTSVSTACAAGTHSIGDSFNYIRMGYADIMLAGGTESSINPLSISGFARMKALSESSVPGTASRPFDSARNGFVMSEGAGIVVLEELSVAQSRGANMIAEIIGFGLSGDAHHPTHPSAEGSGAERSMRNALDDAGKYTQFPFSLSTRYLLF
jgi:3-oxoacyl-[acyl-carrier-protein] synthase II